MKLMLNGKEVSGMGHYVMAGDIKDATAEDSNVLSGKSYYNNNGKREGTMPNRGGMSVELAAGGSVSIPEGYHNGEGVVRAQDLASQTAGDAGAGNIDSGKTAWVNGVQVTGTSTKVDTSGATATANDIAQGKTAWVNSVLVTGTNTDIVPEKLLLDLTGYTYKGESVNYTKAVPTTSGAETIFFNAKDALVNVTSDYSGSNTATVRISVPAKSYVKTTWNYSKAYVQGSSKSLIVYQKG